MTSIIVLFPRIEDAKNIRNLLAKNGFSVSAVCTTGAQALQYAEELNDGVVVCGYKFADMLYTELREYLPSYFDLLLVASRSRWDDARGSNVVCVEMPLKAYDLLNTVNMIVETIERRRRKRRMQPTVRNDDEKKIILEAKTLLMERNNLTEEEAHRYLQKTSMDSGTNMVETAQMVLSIMS